MTESWILINDKARSAAENMAADRALLHHIINTGKKPILRFYRWASPSISLGYFQKPGEVLNLELCQKQGIEVVKRITGGRAVYHGSEITYSIVFPAGHSHLKGGINATYRRISQALVRGLNLLGKDFEFAPNTLASPKTCRTESDCYRSLARYEISHEGRKLIGSAQRRISHGVLQHGSLPIAKDTALLSLYLNKKPSPNLFAPPLFRSPLAAPRKILK